MAMSLEIIDQIYNIILTASINGVHYNFEVDRSEVNSERHRSVILNNDPYSVFEKRIIK